MCMMTMNGSYMRWAVNVFIAVAMSLFAVPAQRVWAQAQRPTEYQVKAAYLYNIAKFVEWPECMFGCPKSPVVFGILGEDPFGGALEEVKNRTISGREIRIRRFESVKDVMVCHILFISRSEKKNLPDILREVGAAPLLLVGDMDEFAQRGGMINLALKNETVTLEINVDALNRAGIKVNSRLLNMSRIVHEKKQN